MVRSGRASLVPVAAALALVFFLWVVVFVLRPGNFFLLMAANTAILAVLVWNREGWLPARADVTVPHVLLGLAAALLLYAIFWAGNAGLKLFHSWLGLLPDRGQRLDAIYTSGGSLSPLLTAVLLVLPIGFGEELFWRGFIQRRLSERLGRWRGFFITCTFYTAVHLCSGNPVLILAALVCGLFWGGLYAWSGSLVLVLVAHMVWDPLIFVLFPIR